MKTGYRTILGNRFSLPSVARNVNKVFVYGWMNVTIMPRPLKTGLIDFAKTAAAQGIHIVKIAMEGNDRVLP